MAEGRFLSKTIAHSAQLAELQDAAEVLFYRMLPHLDCEGRMAGDPKLVKAIAVPLKDAYTVDAVTDLLYLLAETKDSDGTPLLFWYEVKGKRVIQYPGFASHQRGLRKDKEAPSRLPAMTDGGIPVARRQRSRPKDGVKPDQGRNRSDDVAEEVGVREGKLKGSLREDEGKVAPDGADTEAGPLTPRLALSSTDQNGGGWPAEFAAAYEKIGMVAAGQVGRALKPVVDKHGLERTREMWGYYIRHGPSLRFGKLEPGHWDTSRMSPADFVKNLGTWLQKTQPIGGADAATVS